MMTVDPVAALFGFFVLLGGGIGVYVKLSTDIALLKQNVEQLEEFRDWSRDQHASHDEKHNVALVNIEKMFGELKMLIEQKKTN
jgi:hypothetical protein